MKFVTLAELSAAMQTGAVAKIENGHRSIWLTKDPWGICDITGRRATKWGNAGSKNVTIYNERVSPLYAEDARQMFVSRLMCKDVMPLPSGYKEEWEGARIIADYLAYTRQPYMSGMRAIMVVNAEDGERTVLDDVYNDFDLASYICMLYMGNPYRYGYTMAYQWLVHKDWVIRDHDGKMSDISQPYAIVDVWDPRNKYETPFHTFRWENVYKV